MSDAVEKFGAVLTDINNINGLLPEAIELILSLRTPKGVTILSDMDDTDATTKLAEAEAEAFLDEKPQGDAPTPKPPEEG